MFERGVEASIIGRDFENIIINDTSAAAFFATTSMLMEDGETGWCQVELDALRRISGHPRLSDSQDLQIARLNQTVEETGFVDG